MKKKELETWLYSTLGVVAMLSSSSPSTSSPAARKTARRSHRGARLHALARHAGDPREARYAGADPLLLHARRQRDAGHAQDLRAARRGSARRISAGFQRPDRNPEARSRPDSDAEDSAKLDGVEGQQPAERRADLSRLEREHARPESRRFRSSRRTASACSNTISRARSPA